MKLSRRLLSAIAGYLHVCHVRTPDCIIWPGGIMIDGEYEAAARGPTRRRAEANS